MSHEHEHEVESVVQKPGPEQVQLSTNSTALPVEVRRLVIWSLGELGAAVNDDVSVVLSF